VNVQLSNLALAQAASDAFENVTANLVVIDAAIDRLRGQVDIDDVEFDVLVKRLHGVLDTNRTAPAVMRIMAFADAARVASGEAADRSNGWRSRSAWRKLADRSNDDLLAQLATTLDAILSEPF
jgi:hypothetical protein